MFHVHTLTGFNWSERASITHIACLSKRPCAPSPPRVSASPCLRVRPSSHVPNLLITHSLISDLWPLCSERSCKSCLTHFLSPVRHVLNPKSPSTHFVCSAVRQAHRPELGRRRSRACRGTRSKIQNFPRPLPSVAQGRKVTQSSPGCLF